MPRDEIKRKRLRFSKKKERKNENLSLPRTDWICKIYKKTMGIGLIRNGGGRGPTWRRADRQPHLYTRRDGRLPVVAANDTSETRRGR